MCGSGALGSSPGIARRAVVAAAMRLRSATTLPVTGDGPAGLLPCTHRALRGLEIEAQSSLWPVAKAHRAKIHGVGVHVVQGDIQRSGQLLGVEELVDARTGALEELYDAIRGALGDLLDVLVVEGHYPTKLAKIAVFRIIYDPVAT